MKTKRKLTHAEEFFFNVYYEPKCKTSDKYIVKYMYKDEEDNVWFAYCGTNANSGTFHVSYTISEEQYKACVDSGKYKKCVLVPIEIINKFLTNQ